MEDATMVVLVLTRAVAVLLDLQVKKIDIISKKIEHFFD
jgi:hypothetical protein